MDLSSTTAAQAATDPTLAAFLLDRLASLVTRRDTALDERQRVTLARCVFSVFLDCRDLGLGAEAADILTGDPAAPRRAA